MKLAQRIQLHIVRKEVLSNGQNGMDADHYEISNMGQRTFKKQTEEILKYKEQDI